MSATMYSFMDSKENISNKYQALHFLFEPRLSSADLDLRVLYLEPFIPLKLSNREI